MSLNEGKGKPLSKRTKPTFITVGKRKMISTGRFNAGLVADYIFVEGLTRWVPIGEVARVTYGSQTINTKSMIRHRLPKVNHEMVNRGKLLVYQRPKPSGRTIAVKIFTGDTEEEQEAMVAQIEMRRKRKESSQEQYERELSLLQQIREEIKASAINLVDFEW
jgi:hypothetical protein